jgi:hypothetical protein
VCKEVGWRVGALLSKRGEWDGAATAFAAALAGADLTLNARIDTTARQKEIQGAGNLHRWAAYALAQAGDPEAAALAHDGGRARELQRRLGVSDSNEPTLARVPAELREHYESALAAFIASPIDGADTMASRRLGEATAAIRELPDLSRFRTGPQWDEITSAIEPGWPLVYVNPTPQGTLLLLLSERCGMVSTEAKFIEVNSTEVFMRLFVGGGDLDETIEASRGSYLIAASGQGNDQDIAGNLDELLPWLGETIVGPLADLLRRDEATGATLVLCGPLDSAPLHAAPLSSNGETFADAFELRYAPSATVCAAAITRAETANVMPRRLVALADPLGDLSAARPEIEEIAALFDTGASMSATGTAATTSFLNSTRQKRVTFTSPATLAAGCSTPAKRPSFSPPGRSRRPSSPPLVGLKHVSLSSLPARAPSRRWVICCTRSSRSQLQCSPPAAPARSRASGPSMTSPPRCS